MSGDRKNRSLRSIFVLLAIPVIVVGGIAVNRFSQAGLQISTSSSESLLTHTVAKGNLSISVIEQGTLESTENTEIKCKVRGENTVIWVVENGSQVNKDEVLVKLDTLVIEDTINERSKYALWSLSGAENARANAKRAALAINEYEEGRFVTQLKTIEKDLAIAKSNLLTSMNMLQHASQMFERGYASQLELDEKTFAVTQAKLSVEGRQTDIDVLMNYTKNQELEQLRGDLKAAEANRDSLNERAKMDGTRRDLALAEKILCTIRAPKDGMVIYPSAQSWEKTPDIEEGATVHRNQTLLLMPDLNHMQVKVGIHESMIDRISIGMRARITLPEQKMPGEVSEIAAVAQPAGWWTGNLVKYDTVVKLPQTSGLRPGMSAEVEIYMAEYTDVMLIPVAAVLETDSGNLCWVQLSSGEIERRNLTLGDSNDVMIVVQAGLSIGENVVLNPRGSIEDARNVSIPPPKPTEPSKNQPSQDPQPESSSVPPAPRQ